MIVADQLWPIAESVFHDALSVDPATRSEFLERRCAGNAMLRQSVDMLLRGHESAAPDFISPPEHAISQPTRIGRYRIIRLIASGGMGSVYEAEQESPHRTVAIKVLRSTLASTALLRRFLQESEVLASLHHPGIAQVYEAGSYQESAGPVPFFALEFIPGARTITDFARDLPRQEILNLFLRTCEAVHHAHQRGVIHRDLKPANILVDQAGNPKVIDFGMAQAGGVPEESMHTNAGQLMGTLAYMSPEQCAGDPTALDIRSDVYSLGVLLYQLLCRRLPFDSADKPFLEAARIIREEPVPRPGALDRSLRGDLETIILAAIARDRSRRYQSVAELAADLQRFRNHETIAARPATAMYQLRMFSRRHRPLAVGAAIATVGLVLGTAAATWQAAAAIDERDRARNAELVARIEAETAKRIATCLQVAIASMDPRYAGEEGQSPAVILHASAESVARELKDRPLAQAALFERLGDSYFSLGLYERARSMFEPAERLLAMERTDLRDLFRVQTKLARTCIEVGDLVAAERLSRRAAARAQEAELSQERRAAGVVLAETLFRRGDLAAAQAAAESTLRDASEHRLPITEIRTLLAGVLERRGNVSDARDQFVKAVAAAESPLMSAKQQFALAAFESRQGRRAAAEQASATAMTIWKAAAGSITLASAETSREIAMAQFGDHRWEAAEFFLRDALARFRELAGPRHQQVAVLSQHLADVLQMLDRSAEAAPLYREAASAFKAAVGDEHPDVGACLFHLARISASSGDVDTLQQLRVEAAELERSGAKLPADHPHRSGLLLLTAFIDMSVGAAAAAEPSLRECVRLREQHLGLDNKITVYAQSVLGECLTRLGRFEEAEAILLASVPRVEARYIKGSFMATEARQRLVDLYVAWGKPERAEAVRTAAPAER